MNYSKEQIEALGGRPPRRGPSGDLTRRERREVRAAAEFAVEGETYLEKLFRGAGYTGKIETWAIARVVDLWLHIGEPVFEPKHSPCPPENDPKIGIGDGWCLPHGGYWPYLDKEYHDISHVIVGKRIINVDDIYCHLRDLLKEEIQERKKHNETQQ